MLSVYTDGSCLKNPGGAGGWAFGYHSSDLDPSQGGFCMKSGGEVSTTNNRMEVMAIIEAVLYFDDHIPLRIYTDSQYAIGVLSGNWKAKANLDLVDCFKHLVQGRTIEWRWVKGHNGDYGNEMVDKEAGLAARRTLIEGKYGL